MRRAARRLDEVSLVELTLGNRGGLLPRERRRSGGPQVLGPVVVAGPIAQTFGAQATLIGAQATLIGAQATLIAGPCSAC